MSESHNGEKPKTHEVKQTVQINEEFKQQYLEDIKIDKDNTPAPNSKEVALFIMGVRERIDFDTMSKIILGRFDAKTKQDNQFDLTSYRGVAKGVSRTHCQLEFEDGNVIITDLGSSNGTFVAGQRLEPNQPRVLKQGDDVIVGRLPIHIVTGR